MMGQNKEFLKKPVNGSTVNSRGICTIHSSVFSAFPLQSMFVYSVVYIALICSSEYVYAAD